jgi:hypothetical protein
MKTLVRHNVGKTVFEIDPVTLEPKTTSCYDPWCFSSPDPDVIYIGFYDWLERSRLIENREYG